MAPFWQKGEDQDTVEASIGLPPDFCEAEYLAASTDVRKAVKTGQIASGAQHYLAFGRNEGRDLTKSYVYNPAELDERIARLQVLEQANFSDWLRGRHGFHYFEDVSALPADLLSPEYRQAQLAIYHEIAGGRGV